MRRVKSLRLSLVAPTGEHELHFHTFAYIPKLSEGNTEAAFAER